MPKINVLPKEVAELIAAGEVVERPLSVVKEMVENAIDAKADTITVEIQHGGISYIRITDNGCGISHDDVPLAFLRHATSKIRIETDLDSISTLGFRGEALAAVSSVARVELFTKTKDSELGTHYCIEGGEQTVYEDVGFPNGTTIIIRDLFYNTPARMKFLKKDSTEANTVAAVIDRIAISHPEISFKFIRDSKQTLSTTGDGKLQSAVYSVLGREFSQTLIPVDNTLGRITVKGLTCKPVFCRKSRNYQYVFLNGRLVQSLTVMAAVEQAYKNSSMIGKFPGYVFNIEVPYDTVDVNVHPAKTEVRFSNEKLIFDAVYAAVKNALTAGDTRPEIKISKPVFNPYQRMSVEQFKQEAILSETSKEKKTSYETSVSQAKPILKNDTFGVSQSTNKFVDHPKSVAQTFESKPKVDIDFAVEDNPMPQVKVKDAPEKQIKTDVISETDSTPKPIDVKPVLSQHSVETNTNITEMPDVKLIGQAFDTYIIVQSGNSVYMIDKHAAHERILFNKLKKEEKVEVQSLLSPISVTLDKSDYDTIISNTDLLYKSGFEIEDFGNSSVVVRSVPSNLTHDDIFTLVTELADSLSKCGSVEIQKLENLYHTVACKAAIKAGSITSNEEMLSLAKRVLSSPDVMYCPHGRPVAFEIKKYDLEKQFGRIQ